MKTIDKYLTMLVRGVIGVALIVLFVVAFSVIIGRIFFDASMGWSQDVIRLCFTYIIYLGAAYCVREKGHLNVDFVLGMMKPQVRKAVEFVINIVLLAFFAFIVYYGFQFAATGASQKSPYLMLPMTYYYYGVPISGILLIAGTFIDTTSAIVIFAPLFIPICKAMNVDLVHFGMIMTVNLTIGMCTPPLGVCLFVSSSIAKISLKDQMRDLLPMLAVLIGVLLLVTYIPGLTLWLPSLFK